jgi:hypothetical protein
MICNFYFEFADSGGIVLVETALKDWLTLGGSSKNYNRECCCLRNGKAFFIVKKRASILCPTGGYAKQT